MAKTRGLWEGWPLVGWAALGVAIVVALALGSVNPSEAALRSAIRATATSSLILFLAAFVASSWNALAPSSASKWLLRNRRQLGVSFAVSHFAHGALIVALATRFPDSFWRAIAPTTLIGGSIGYVFIALMTATSFDRPAAWLGRPWWRRLHTAGVFYLWGVFAFSYLGRVRSPRYAALFALVVIAIVLRIAAAMRRRRRSKKD